MTSDVEKLLQRAAQVPSDFRSLHHGQPESLACLFQVHPSVVLAAKERLRSPTERARFARLLAGARRSGAKPRAAQVQPPAPAQAPTAASLLRELKAHPEGLELLAHAPAETVATLFGVHPFLVDEARELSLASGSDRGA